ASLMTWISETGGVFNGGSSFSAIYHTDYDVFDPKLVPNLDTDLRIEALAITRADRAVALPIEFSGIAAWVEAALKGDEAKAPGVTFADARAAVGRLKEAAARVESARASIASDPQAGPVNKWLMRTRKDLLPWLMGRGAGGVRTTALANQVQTLAAVRTALERGDRAAAVTAIARQLGPGARVSRET